MKLLASTSWYSQRRLKHFFFFISLCLWLFDSLDDFRSFSTFHLWSIETNAKKLKKKKQFLSFPTAKMLQSMFFFATNSKLWVCASITMQYELRYCIKMAAQKLMQMDSNFIITTCIMPVHGIVFAFCFFFFWCKFKVFYYNCLLLAI